MEKLKNNLKEIVIVVIGIIFIAAALIFNQETSENIVSNEIGNTNTTISYSLENIPEYSGEIYITINDNIPEFSEEDLLLEEDYYSELDADGRVRNGNDKNKLGKNNRR